MSDLPMNLIPRTGIVATYLFVGNGAKLQYKDMDAVRQCLSEVNTENYNFCFILNSSRAQRCLLVRKPINSFL